VDADFRGITNVETLNLLSAATNTITLGTIATNTAGIVNIVAAGTGNDTITTGVGSHTVTTAAGTDSIVVTASVAAAITSDAAIKLTTINDWAASDALTFTIGATNTFTTAAINVTAATTLLGALDIAVVGAGNTNNLITWFQLGGNTYIVNHTGASSDLAATDVVVKLIGTFDLSDETFAEGGAAASTLTFA
jgi:S-layer protein